LATSGDVAFSGGDFRNTLSGKEEHFQPSPRRIIMRKLSTILLALVISLTTIGTAAAHQSIGINGVLLGGAGGALAGQVLTRNPEGVIVGTIIGGTLGMLVDIGAARDRVVVIDRSRHPARHAVVYSDHRPVRHAGWSHGKHRYSERQWRQDRWRHRR
jgi:hypothetical protein